MTRIEEWIVVDAPAGVAYERWMGLEELPDHWRGIDAVGVYTDGDRGSWSVGPTGPPQALDVRLTEVLPGERISWWGMSGPPQDGSVSFMGLGDGRSTVVVQMTGAPGGMSRRVREDLAGFKRAVETAHDDGARAGRAAARPSAH